MEKHKILPTKELKRLKKEKKERTAEKIIKNLERRELMKSVASNSAKPVPKNIISELSSDVKGRNYTISIAVPGSILDNAQTPELRTYLAGQVARAAAVFSVDEVVVYDDEGVKDKINSDLVVKKSRGCEQLSKILQYLECPQYLRKHFFPIHKDLQFAGVLNPTDMPHHLRTQESSLYREGIVTDRPAKEGSCFVNIGLKGDCMIKRSIKPGMRVTVRLSDDYEWDKKLSGKVVSPSEPRTKAGLYWGYTVRIAKDLSSVLTGCPFPDGYDLTLGTSEKGTDVDDCTLPEFKHLLIVFGGVGGIEAALEVDEQLQVNDPKDLFDQYINTCPSQGSRTIRSEEAILITMATLRHKISAAVGS
ncbi:putative methyltransferase C9orf114 [Eurytemora carolleeae]|uniref:putative methyltransferase C9orf114 n=1 Tax=Eurytemora carolleeae TaxID=1294199 RepID=UPI000C77DAA7|nr:putative methyltransferase C9orf114 [Eurytemora carolleeae]|eukprot:XP_023328155.1 putative methyltransferase C9orf114 [Eurytemora affinis]